MRQNSYNTNAKNYLLVLNKFSKPCYTLTVWNDWHNRGGHKSEVCTFQNVNACIQTIFYYYGLIKRTVNDMII